MSALKMSPAKPALAQPACQRLRRFGTVPVLLFTMHCHSPARPAPTREASARGASTPTGTSSTNAMPTAGTSTSSTAGTSTAAAPTPSTAAAPTSASAPTTASSTQPSAAATAPAATLAPSGKAASSQSAADSCPSDEVEQALRTQASARVIMMLRTSNSKQALHAAQGRVLSRLGREFSVSHRYTSIPALAGSLTSAGFERARNHPDVRCIQLDQPGGGH